MRKIKKLTAILIIPALLLTGFLRSQTSTAAEMPATEETEPALATENDNQNTSVIVKQYGILTVDAKGIYSFWDFSKDTDGRIETTDKGNIMIPLKKTAAQLTELKLSYNKTTKKATVTNTVNKKKITFTLGSSTFYYYSSSKAKGVKKTMASPMYISKESKALMVHMAALKWVLLKTEGVKSYKVSDMQAKGYDTTALSGVIVYNPYGKVTSLVEASKVSNIGRTVKVTIPEGYSLPQVFTLLVRKGVCASEEVLYKAMEEYDFTRDYSLIDALEDNPDRCYLLEGYLYPDTYEFYRLSKGEDAIGKFLRNGDGKITEADKKKAAELGLTINQILTIASLVEKEGKDKETKYNISSVIHNRLKINMKLQLDASIHYVEKYIKPFIDGDINRYNSFYNTYKCPALPAGPICNPGREAINAALNPPQTDYLYFYSDEQKNYYFSKEYHNQ
ncbi:endolytic transglycosylase MltG [Anaerocolumna sp. AGMB13020]|uniref:endolytic transglycosylase MltG n=1 Tax=Anaerocolumna sp. AGMB13020 TaxID=3081750 RepID=UPI0029538DD1|nr:endolytic transglycosylase MltG [Anaerocolumna sp. AGMB13020]WOO36300.1 endolytic transglycosylase MltG [Anaerocolumna sp. AGMB13020]